MQSHLHPTTVISALHILVTILRNSINVTRFREGNFGGGWLGDTESVLKNQMAAMLGKSYCIICMYVDVTILWLILVFAHFL